MTTALTPSELRSKEDAISFGVVSLTAPRAKFEADPDSPKARSMVNSSMKMNRQPVKMLLKGELVTQNISLQQHEDFGDKYSFGLKLDSIEDEEAIEGICALLPGAIQDDAEDHDFDVRSPFKDGILYLKCKVNGEHTKFMFETNIKGLTPKKLPCADLTQYMPIKVEVTVGAYYNLRDDFCGLYFTITRLNRDIDESPQEEMATSSPREIPPKRALNTRSKKWSDEGVDVDALDRMINFLLSIIEADVDPPVTCLGCKYDQPNQGAHMGRGGCLESEGDDLEDDPWNFE